MKKAVLILGISVAVFIFSSCESSDINEEQNELEFNIQKTDKGDSVNSGGGGVDRPNND